MSCWAGAGAASAAVDLFGRPGVSPFPVSNGVLYTTHSDCILVTKGEVTLGKRKSRDVGNQNTLL